MQRIPLFQQIRSVNSSVSLGKNLRNNENYAPESNPIDLSIFGKRQKICEEE